MEDPARSREALQSALEKVNNELGGLKKLWTSERQSLLGEKAVLRDTANRLTAEVKAEAAKVEQERKNAREAANRIKDEGERQKALMQAVSCLFVVLREIFNAIVNVSGARKGQKLYFYPRERPPSGACPAPVVGD